MRNIWQQEWYRLRAKRALLWLIVLIAVGGGLSIYWGLFVHEIQTFTAFYEVTFDRFFIYYVVIPLTVVAGAMVTQYRLVDSLFCRQRAAVYYQTMCQNLLIASFIWLGWSLASQLLVLVRLWSQYPRPLIWANGLGVLTLLVVQLMFSSLFLNLYFLTKSKIVAVIGALAINVGIFELSMRGYNTFLYEFTKLGDNLARLGQLWLLVIALIGFNVVTYWLVLEREF